MPGGKFSRGINSLSALFPMATLSKSINTITYILESRQKNGDETKSKPGGINHAGYNNQKRGTVYEDQRRKLRRQTEYNEKYPSGAGPGKIEELIDMTSLPSAELPADLAEHTNYPIWAADVSGACLVGAGADTIETADEIREALDLPLPKKEA